MDQSRWTDRSKRVLELAAEEALALRSPDMGTGHLLAGMLAEGECMAARILGHLGYTLDMARADLAAIGGGRSSAPEAAPGETPLSLRLKRAVHQRAQAEALELGQSWIGTEHLLLAVLGIEKCDAVLMLSWHGITPATVRKTVLHVLGAGDGPRVPAGPLTVPAVPLTLQTLQMVQTAAWVARDDDKAPLDAHRERLRLLGLAATLPGEEDLGVGAALARLVITACLVAQTVDVDLGAEVAAQLGAVNDGSDDEGAMRP